MSYEDYLPIIQQVTNLDSARPVPEAQISQYGDLIPAGLREVWRRHGNALLIGDGRMQFCDPAPVQAALAPWFSGDRELSIDRLVPFAYSSLGSVLLTDGNLTLYDLGLEFSKLAIIPLTIPSEDMRQLEPNLARRLRNRLSFIAGLDTDIDDHLEASRELGPIGIGDVFGWEPPFQVVVDETNKLHKFTITDLITRTQALGPLELHRTFRDELEAAKYLGETFVRNIGGPR